MSDRVAISITATDGASRVFGQVAQGADRMGQSLDRAESSTRRFSAAGAALGAAIGTTISVLSDAARLAAEAEVSQQRLATSIEATGATYEEYADQLDAAGEAAIQMAFDDEAAADAISFLTQATGDAQTAIDDLGLAMDIARGRGIGLAEAAKIVAAAEQGRFTALRRIGIQLDENATSEEAIAALQQKYAGQAAAYAETNQAALQRWGVELENHLETIGATTGELQSLLMVLPGLSAGFSAAAAAAGGFFRLLSGSALSGGGMLGAGGVAAGGILGGLGLVGWMLANPEATGISKDIPYFEAFEQEATDLQLTLAALQQSGNTYAVTTGEQAGAIVSNLTALSQRHHELLYLIENDTEASTEQTAAYWHELGVVQEQLGQQFADNSAYYLSGLASDIDTIVGYTGDGASLMQKQLAELNQQFESGWLSPAEYASQVDMLASSMASYDEQAQNTTASTAALDGAVTDYIGTIYAQNLAHQQAAIDAAALANAQANLERTFTATQTAVTSTTAALESGFRVAVGNTSAIAKQSQAIADWATELGGATEHFDEFGNSLGTWSRMDEIVEGTANGIRAATLSQDDYTAATEAFNDIARENEEIQQDIAVIQAQQAPIIADLIEQQENYLQSVAEMSPEMQTYTLAMMDSATSAKALELSLALLGENGDVFAPMVESAANLDPYLAAILLQMGLIEEQPDGTYTVVADVADAQSDLDRLVEATERLAYTNILISVDFDEEAARQKFYDIFGFYPGEGGGTAEPVVVDQPVEVKPFPDLNNPDNWDDFWADVFPPDPEPIDVDVPAEPNFGWEQTQEGFTPPDPPVVDPIATDVPLTPVWVWPDAAAGDGTGGPSPAGDMSPVVVPIEADTSGWTSGAESVQSQASELDSYVSTPDIIADTTGYDASASSVETSLGDIDGMTATPTINAQDNASSAIYAAIGAMNQLDGMVANSYINTYVTTISSFIGSGTSPLGGALGGVMGYGAGGVVAEMAEWGPELLHFPNGGVALARQRGLYTVPAGTYVDTAPATATKLGGSLNVTVNVNGPSSWDDAAEQVSRKIIPAIQRAMRQYEQSLGVA